MRVFNIIDEKLRMSAQPKFYITKPYEKDCQYDSHTMSYVGLRKLYQDFGMVMGLDRQNDNYNKR